MRDSDIERFWSKVRIGDSCWEWSGARSDGYGTYGHEGRTVYAHRTAWTLANGEIPPGMWVLHRCDNPPCIRPSHLFLGTQADNVADMWAKKRGAVGERHGSHTHPESRASGVRNGRHTHPELVARGILVPSAVLCDEDALAIRDAYARGDTIRAIAKQFGVSFGAARNVITHESWAHVGGPSTPTRPRGTRGARVSGAVLRESDVVLIRVARAAGETHKQIARRHGVSRSTVTCLLAGKSWQWLAAREQEAAQ